MSDIQVDDRGSIKSFSDEITVGDEDIITDFEPLSPTTQIAQAVNVLDLAEVSPPITPDPRHQRLASSKRTSLRSAASVPVFKTPLPLSAELPSIRSATVAASTSATIRAQLSHPGVGPMRGPPSRSYFSPWGISSSDRYTPVSPASQRPLRLSKSTLSLDSSPPDASRGRGRGRSSSTTSLLSHLPVVRSSSSLSPSPFTAATTGLARLSVPRRASLPPPRRLNVQVASTPERSPTVTNALLLQTVQLEVVDFHRGWFNRSDGERLLHIPGPYSEYVNYFLRPLSRQQTEVEFSRTSTGLGEDRKEKRLKGTLLGLASYLQLPTKVKGVNFSAAELRSRLLDHIKPAELVQVQRETVAEVGRYHRPDELTLTALEDDQPTEINEYWQLPVIEINAPTDLNLPAIPPVRPAAAVAVPEAAVFEELENVNGVQIDTSMLVIDTTPFDSRLSAYTGKVVKVLMADGHADNVHHPATRAYIHTLADYVLRNRLQSHLTHVVEEVERWIERPNDLQEAISIRSLVDEGSITIEKLKRLYHLFGTDLDGRQPCAYLAVFVASADACSRALDKVDNEIQRIQSRQAQGERSQEVQSLGNWMALKALLAKGFAQGGLRESYFGLASLGVVDRQRAQKASRDTPGIIGKLAVVFGLTSKAATVSTPSEARPWSTLTHLASLHRIPLLPLTMPGLREDEIVSDSSPVVLSRHAAFQEAIAAVWSTGRLNCARPGAPLRHDPGSLLRESLASCVVNRGVRLVLLLPCPPSSGDRLPALADHAQGVILHDLLGSLLGDGFSYRDVELRHVDCDPRPGAASRRAVDDQRCQAINQEIDDMTSGNDVVVIACGATAMSCLAGLRSACSVIPSRTHLENLGELCHTVRVERIGSGRDRLVVCVPEPASLVYAGSSISAFDVMSTSLTIAVLLHQQLNANPTDTPQGQLRFLQNSPLAWLLERQSTQFARLRSEERLRRGALNGPIRSLPVTVVLNPVKTTLEVWSGHSYCGVIVVELTGNAYGGPDNSRLWKGRPTVELRWSASGEFIYFSVVDSTRLAAVRPSDSIETLLEDFKRPGAILQQLSGQCELAWRGSSPAWEALWHNSSPPVFPPVRISRSALEDAQMQSAADLFRRLVMSARDVGALTSAKAIDSRRVQIDLQRGTYEKTSKGNQDRAGYE